MHATRLAAAAMLLALPLTACAKAEDTTTSAKTVDCSDAELPQAQRAAHCDDAAQPGAAGDTESEPLKLGTPATTQGTRFQNGGGELEITPTTVVYTAEAQGEKPENEVFAVVTVKDKPTGRAAGESAPVEGGGWEWVAPSGEAIEAGNGAKAGALRIQGFDSDGGIVQAGTFVWGSKVFDLKEDQRGGTLVYVDGDGKTHRWQMPQDNIGPHVTELKQKLAG